MGEPVARAVFEGTQMTPAQVGKPIVLDLLAAIAVAAVFFVAKHGLGISGLHSVYAATVAGIGIGAIQLATKIIAREKIGPLQWLSLGVVLALGAMTIFLHNEISHKAQAPVCHRRLGRVVHGAE